MAERDKQGKVLVQVYTSCFRSSLTDRLCQIKILKKTVLTQTTGVSECILQCVRWWCLLFLFLNQQGNHGVHSCYIK